MHILLLVRKIAVRSLNKIMCMVITADTKEQLEADNVYSDSVRNHRVFFLRSLRLETGVMGVFLFAWSCDEKFFWFSTNNFPKKSTTGS